MKSIKTLCKTYDITIEIDVNGVIIRKFFKYKNKTYGYSYCFPFDILQNISLEDCILEFIKVYTNELDKRGV